MIIGKLGKTTKTDDVTDILAEYGLDRSTSRSWNWKKPWKFGNEETVKTNQIKFDVGESSYRDPSKMSLWNWNRRAAIRDAKTNLNNPYFSRYGQVKPVSDMELYGFQPKPGDLTVFNPNLPVRYIPREFRARPITPVIMSNLAPDLGLFGRHPVQYQMFDPHNPPVFYKKGGKIVKAVLGDNTSN